MKIILGGGLAALLARDILGNDWTIIPVGRSRYFSFSPALANNFIIRDPAIDEYIRKFAIIPIMHRVGYSYAGQITFNLALTLQPWLQKVYGQVPAHAEAYWKSRVDFFALGDCIDIYRTLQEQYKNELFGKDYGKLVKIKDHVVTTTTGSFEYDQLISTIPLQNLLSLTGVTTELAGCDEYFYHVTTESLNFENATILHVVDEAIDFYKVRMLNKTNYIFHSTREIEYPGRYLMQFMPKFDLIRTTSIQKSIPCGSIPQVDFAADDIICMGGQAVWDDCLDIGSVIKRLIKLKQ